MSTFVDESVKTVLDTIQLMGQAMVSTIAPHDIEYYMVALELTDSSNKTIDYFSFPILPQSIQKTEPVRTALKQTASGVTVITSNTFTPQKIVLKGNFGKYFKMLLDFNDRAGGEGGTAAIYSCAAGTYNLSQLTSEQKAKFGLVGLNGQVKSGYGAMNILRAIVSKSVGVDKLGAPFRLYFYNMALGESYLVSVPAGGLVVDTNVQGSNFLWNYTLTLDILASMELALKKKTPTSSLKSMLTAGVMQSGVNNFASSMTSMLSNLTIGL